MKVSVCMCACKKVLLFAPNLIIFLYMPKETVTFKLWNKIIFNTVVLKKKKTRHLTYTDSYKQQLYAKSSE